MEGKRAHWFLGWDRNIYFYIGYKSGVAASIYSQHLPFNHHSTVSLFEKFSKAVYERFEKPRLGIVGGGKCLYLVTYRIFRFLL